MPDSLDDLDLELTRLPERRSREPQVSPAADLRRSLRGKHVCPFCGTTRETDVGHCSQCSLEDTPATRAATRNKLGPWYVLQLRNPSAPGMNFATLMALVQKGRVTARSVIRGPTTGQFWKHAAKVKGVSREFGLCWNCGGDLPKSARACSGCKRLQEPPLNPDLLLEPGEPTEDLAEKMWAAEPPQEPSRTSTFPANPATPSPASANGPVDDFLSRGGIRREVPASAAASRPRHAPRGLLADADEQLQVPSPLEMAVFQNRGRSGPPYRGSAGRTLVKIAGIALLVSGLGFGAMCYFDPATWSNAVKWYEQSIAWIQSNFREQASRGGAGSSPAVVTPRETALTDNGTSSENAKLKVWDLWRAGVEAERRGDYTQAVKAWEDIKVLPVTDADWPLGLEARIGAAKKKLHAK